jgi:hypothetical protein
MSTAVGKIKVLADNQLRLTSNTTIQGAAQAKGTATDCLLTVIGGADGANPVAGTVTVTVQGSNVTTGGWVTITADKGTAANLSTGGIPNVTVAGVATSHLAQLQYAYYRVALSAAAATTADTTAVWNFMPVQDSFDASVA